MQGPFVPHIALLLFADDCQIEARRKPMGISWQKRIALSKALTRKARKLAESTGLPLHHIGTKHQRGHDFGHRITEAIGDVFANGYTHVIAIGNDSPKLSIRHIKKAILQLEQGKAALGPSLDGGVYLLGLSALQFDKLALTSLPWQTKYLKEALVGWFDQKAFAFNELPHLVDLDQQQDFDRLLAGLRANSLLLRFIQQLNQYITWVSEGIHLSLMAGPNLFQISGRAPPRISLS